MKKYLIGLLLGNVVHFAGREIANYSVGARFRDCRRAEHAAHRDGAPAVTCMKELDLKPWEKVLLYELKLGDKVMWDE